MKLENCKVTELNAEELVIIDGGRKKDNGITLFDIVEYISDNWTEFKKGFLDGWNKE